MQQAEDWDLIENFVVVGMSYQKADIALRSDFTFFPEQTKSICDFFESKAISSHFFILSTCNRTEIYAFGNADNILNAYAEFIQADAHALQQSGFVHKGRAAVRHLFKVSSGLESQILGDFEVIYQMKAWFKRFKKHNKTNAFLERMLNTAIQLSKSVKTQTALSDGIASVSFAAVDYILNHHKTHAVEKILLIGTGKIGRNTCENLIKHLPNTPITLINRTDEKAEKLSEKVSVGYSPYDDLQGELNTSDVVIVATGSSEPIIQKEMLEKHNKQQLIIDLSVPRNAAPEAGKLPHINLIDIDQLSQRVQDTLSERANEIPKVEALLNDSLTEYAEWLHQRKFAPVIDGFKQQLEHLQEHQYQQLKKKEPRLNGVEKSLNQKFIQKLTNRFAAHLLSNEEKAEEIIQLMDEIFHLDIDAKDA